LEVGNIWSLCDGNRKQKIDKEANLKKGKGQTTSAQSKKLMQKQTEAQTPLGRTGQPEDIGRVAAFLASPDSGWITGEILTVAGGYG
jgi:NAD(P)-dependent dehydrogenase (short-subunit alcohol dehydrogenase family)